MLRSVDEEIFFDSMRRLATGKVSSIVFELVLQMEVFQKLHGQALTVSELAESIGVPTTSARMLAQYLCREGLLVYRDGKLSNAPVVERFFSEDTIHLRSLQKLLSLEMPVDVVRERLVHPPAMHWYQMRDEGGINDPRSMVGQRQQGWLEHFFSSNHTFRLLWGEELAARYDFSGHRLLLDIGGATGGWCLGVRKANPHLRCLVFDLPEVRELAEKSIAEAGEQEHVQFVEGSFFSQDLPAGADVALLANVIHGWLPPDDGTILSKTFDALAPGGTLLIKEYFFEDDWTGPSEAVMAAFIVLGKEGQSGWQPTYGETAALLEEAGFVGIERGHNLVLGRKPS